MTRLRSSVKRILSSIREDEQNEMSDNEDTTSNRILVDQNIQIVRESPISGQQENPQDDEDPLASMMKYFDDKFDNLKTDIVDDRVRSQQNLNKKLKL